MRKKSVKRTAKLSKALKDYKRAHQMVQYTCLLGGFEKFSEYLREEVPEIRDNEELSEKLAEALSSYLSKETIYPVVERLLKDVCDYENKLETSVREHLKELNEFMGSLEYSSWKEWV